MYTDLSKIEHLLAEMTSLHLYVSIMGIPSYFSWIVRHFESRLIQQKCPFPVHNFYLDFNCAIHPVVKSQPDLSIEQMCDHVVTYLDYLIQYVNPTELIYLAIDGSAPIAKMKQQRLRRYKSVKETVELNQLKQRYGQPLTANRHDFNMIFAGNSFHVGVD